jgi:hypothetical protein
MSLRVLINLTEVEVPAISIGIELVVATPSGLKPVLFPLKSLGLQEVMKQEAESRASHSSEECRAEEVDDNIDDAHEYQLGHRNPDEVQVTLQLEVVELHGMCEDAIGTEVSRGKLNNLGWLIQDGIVKLEEGTYLPSNEQQADELSRQDDLVEREYSRGPLIFESEIAYHEELQVFDNEE